MKIKSLTVILILFSFSLPVSQVVAQCANTDKIFIPAGYAKSYGSTGNDEAWDIVVLDTDNNPSTDNGYVVVGYTYNVPGESRDVYVIRLNPNLSTAWTYQYDGGYGTPQDDS
ncbi:MAG: hypothetical protein LH473_06735 [Chitinophagales bacterium]|nr:hypothetical protein [Chitinophagales bacterium]